MESKIKSIWLLYLNPLIVDGFRYNLNYKNIEKKAIDKVLTFYRTAALGIRPQGPRFQVKEIVMSGKSTQNTILVIYSIWYTLMVTTAPF